MTLDSSNKKNKNNKDKRTHPHRCSTCGHTKEVHVAKEQEGKMIGFCRGVQYQPGDEPHWFEEAEKCHSCKCTIVHKVGEK